MDPLFPALPEDLGTLSDEALTEALESRLGTVDLIAAEDAETLGERSADDVISQLETGVEQVEAIRAEIASRAEAAEAYETRRQELAAQARGPEAELAADDETAETQAAETGPDDDDEDGDGDEAGDEDESTTTTTTTETETETSEGDAAAESDEASQEPVAASAERQRPRLARPPRAARNRQPLADPAARGGQLVASAGIRGITPGEPLDRDGMAAALLEAHRTTSAAPGRTERVLVASARVEYPEDRRLDDNPTRNTERIEAVVGEQALVAAGGICAPATPFYDLPVVSVADRPVRAALAGFQATRGGISVPAPLSLADVEDGVGVVTAADDELGGTFATKNCVVIDCEPYTDCEIEAVYACIQHGNFGARTWPERVSALADLLSAQHAKVAEIELLDALGDGSTAVTEAAVYGATSSILQAVLVASAAMRSRHRMRPETRLRAIFPAWSIDLMVADMVHTPYDRFERSRAGIESLLSTIGGVSASFYLDGETGAGQIFGAQNAGALLEFPDTVVWYLFPEGTWLFLDGGELDLGIVRDSTLNATNDFQIFMETFEGACMVGVESLQITSTVCPSGTYAPAGTAITC